GRENPRRDRNRRPEVDFVGKGVGHTADIFVAGSQGTSGGRSTRPAAVPQDKGRMIEVADLISNLLLELAQLILYRSGAHLEVVSLIPCHAQIIRSTRVQRLPVAVLVGDAA